MLRRIALCLLAPLPAMAQTATPWVHVIEPAFGQVVFMPAPTRFRIGDQQERDGFHILELAPEGESVAAWSQLMTLTANAGLATSATPEAFRDQFAAGFHKACPESFFAAPVELPPFKGASAQAAMILSCGSYEGQSETAAVIVLAAGDTIFTLQWAEHGQATPGPQQPDWATWEPRFGLLSQGRICPQVAGEEMPYPSCKP
ncbi:hypothetical protein [Stagnihabitans tardus]|uniref:Uncharacterized protein n=1 Tax=Stagnihabitans tardus TaxID=2699202 RepID=A0AAE4YFZ1_9RHOB|nr:hypothetical protein [Stagnihabitans tardus]NBZ88980.1 hypothetical protein [Stagnihabitans tardus]